MPTILEILDLPLSLLVRMNRTGILFTVKKLAEETREVQPGKDNCRKQMILDLSRVQNVSPATKHAR